MNRLFINYDKDNVQGLFGYRIQQIDCKKTRQKIKNKYLTYLKARECMELNSRYEQLK